jgi:ABC-type phosphate transport system substrate-binding protein
MKKKLFGTLSLAIVGALAVGSVALAESINGSGATFPQQFQASATAAFNAATGNNASYANPGGGSSKGVTDFAGGLTDFGGTDSAVSSSVRIPFDWVYVPYVGGAIAVAYRLDELGGATLSLSPATLNGIFGGTITKWNDPSILNDLKSNPLWANSKKKSDLKGATALIANNVPGSATVTVSAIPSVLRSVKGKAIEIVDAKSKKVLKKSTFSKGEISITLGVKEGIDYSVRLNGKELANFREVEVKMPDKSITVVYRSDGSGTTNNFCNFMRGAADSSWAVNNSFTSCIPGGSSRVASLGSRFQGQSGSANVSNYVADNSGSIGYTEVSFVTDATRAAKGMKAANIRNAAARYVAPTAANTSAFLSGSTIDSSGFVTFNYKQSSNTAAYPISAITYMLGKTAKTAKNDTVKQYMEWIINTYAPANAEALGYAPLSGAIRTSALAQAAKVSSK